MLTNTIISDLINSKITVMKLFLELVECNLKVID